VCRVACFRWNFPVPAAAGIASDFARERQFDEKAAAVTGI